MVWLSTVTFLDVLLLEVFCASVCVQNSCPPTDFFFLHRKHILTKSHCSYAFCPSGASVAPEQRAAGSLAVAVSYGGRKEEEAVFLTAPCPWGQVRRHIWVGG